MRVVKFVLIDILFISVLTLSFLFNSDNDLRVNILLSISIGLASLFFELFFVTFYIISLTFDLYSRLLHVLLFSTFFLYINYIAFEYFKEHSVIGLSFYLFIFFFSILLIALYYKALVIFDRI